MQEILQDILDYLKGIWIKRRYIIISTWLICPIGWYMVASMPNVYKSQARVFVDTQSMLRPLLRGLTIDTNPNTQIRLMVKTLLSRTNLERISRMTDLDIQATNDRAYEGVIARLKKGIKIKGTSRENIYTLSFVDRNAEMAKNIVQATLTVFIENTLGETRGDTDTAQKFLDTQIIEYEKRLIASEARLTRYKQKYSNILPNKGGFYGQLNASKSELKAIELELLESQTRLKSAQKQLLEGTQTSLEPHNKITTNNAIKTEYDSRISNLEAQLDSLLFKYTDKHPEVIQINKTLVHLTKLRAEEINNYLKNAKDGNNNYITLSQNPVTQEVQIQANKLKNLIASLKVRANNYQNKVSQLEAKIHTFPEIEAELTALNRGYGIIKGKYTQLLSRKETAMLAQQANESTDKIQFKVLNPPRASNKPAGPARLMLFIMITVAGIGVGVALSLVMSQLNPIVSSSSQLSKATGIPVFGMVSANDNLGLQQVNNKKTIIFVISNVVLLCVLLIFIAYFMFPNVIQAPLKRIF